MQNSHFELIKMIVKDMIEIKVITQRASRLLMHHDEYPCFHSAMDADIRLVLSNFWSLHPMDDTQGWYKHYQNPPYQV